MEEKITITNDVNQLTSLAEKVNLLGSKNKLSQSLVTNMNLALEEAISNIIFYAFDDDKTHEIEIFININKHKLSIQIIDDGKPFDPRKSKEPDIHLPAEEREIGGLGIFLIGKIMDKLDYKREKEKNILTLEKSI